MTPIEPKDAAAYRRALRAFLRGCNSADVTAMYLAQRFGLDFGPGRCTRCGTWDESIWAKKTCIRDLPHTFKKRRKAKP